MSGRNAKAARAKRNRNLDASAVDTIQQAMISAAAIAHGSGWTWDQFFDVAKIGWRLGRDRWGVIQAARDAATAAAMALLLAVLPGCPKLLDQPTIDAVCAAVVQSLDDGTGYQTGKQGLMCCLDAKPKAGTCFRCLVPGNDGNAHDIRGILKAQKADHAPAITEAAP